MQEKYQHESYFENIAYMQTKLAYYNGFRKDDFPVQPYGEAFRQRQLPHKDYTEQDIINMFLGK